LIDLSQLPTPEPVMETIADVEAFEKTPLTEQFPYTDSYNLIKDSADRFGGKAALEFLLQGLPDEPAQTVSFAELGAQVTRTANLLNELGITADDAVSIILPILPQTHFAIWGATSSRHLQSNQPYVRSRAHCRNYYSGQCQDCHLPRAIPA
jgi:Acyl-CoA synthetases (AMP-forming)/AMP-acid ligases II